MARVPANLVKISREKLLRYYNEGRAMDLMEEYGLSKRGLVTRYNNVGVDPTFYNKEGRARLTAYRKAEEDSIAQRIAAMPNKADCVKCRHSVGTKCSLGETPTGRSCREYSKRIITE